MSRLLYQKKEKTTSFLQGQSWPYDCISYYYPSIKSFMSLFRLTALRFYDLRHCLFMSQTSSCFGCGTKHFDCPFEPNLSSQPLIFAPFFIVRRSRFYAHNFVTIVEIFWNKTKQDQITFESAPMTYKKVINCDRVRLRNVVKE